MLVEALKAGFIESNGPYYRQPPTEIRPRPEYSFDGRIHAVASSDDSIVSAAKLGTRMVMFADRPWEMRLPAIEKDPAAPALSRDRAPTYHADGGLHLRPKSLRD